MMELPETYQQTVLETERLYLKELNLDILKYLFTSHTDAELCSYMGMTSEELVIEKYKFDNGRTTYQTSFRNFVMVEKESRRVIGKCGFHTWFFNHSRAEVGYHLTHDGDKRKGFMKEALKAIITYGFEEMKLNRIEAFVGPTNVASLSLVRNLGFTEEGTLREHYYKYPSIEDSICFSLLKREYEGIKNSWS